MFISSYEARMLHVINWKILRIWYKHRRNSVVIKSASMVQWLNTRLPRGRHGFDSRPMQEHVVCALSAMKYNILPWYRQSNINIQQSENDEIRRWNRLLTMKISRHSCQPCWIIFVNLHCIFLELHNTHIHEIWP